MEGVCDLLFRSESADIQSAGAACTPYRDAGLDHADSMALWPNLSLSEVAAFKIIAVLKDWLTKHWVGDLAVDALLRRMGRFVSGLDADKDIKVKIKVGFFVDCAPEKTASHCIAQLKKAANMRIDNRECFE